MRGRIGEFRGLASPLSSLSPYCFQEFLPPPKTLRRRRNFLNSSYFRRVAQDGWPVCFLATSDSADSEPRAWGEGDRNRWNDITRRGRQREEVAGVVVVVVVVENGDVEHVTHGPCRPRLLSSRERTQESWKFTSDKQRTRAKEKRIAREEEVEEEEAQELANEGKLVYSPWPPGTNRPS